MPFSKLFKSRRAPPPDPFWMFPEPAVPVTRRELEAQLPCSPRDIHNFRDPALTTSDLVDNLELAREIYDAFTDAEIKDMMAKLRGLSLCSLVLLTTHRSISYRRHFFDLVSEEMKRRRIPLELRLWLHNCTD